MNKNRNFEDAKVLLFDPVSSNVRVTRAALFEIGFREIEITQTFADLSKHVSLGNYDLIIAEVHNAGGGVADLMQKVRTGDVGDNPFVVSIITSWDRTPENVQQLIGAGIDDLLLRPFSTHDLAARIHVAVSARKGFVVTGNYVGPDRRSSSERSNTVTLFHPPNTLKSNVENDQKAIFDNQKAIDDARLKMSRERIRTLAMRIVVAVELKLDDPEVGASIDAEEIDGLARELRRRLRGRGAADAVELASALVEMTTEALDPDEAVDKKKLRLIRELALGAYTVFAEGAELERSSGEVARTVEVLRDKLQEQSLQDWRKELSCAT